MSRMTSRIAQSAPWMYAATPLTKSLVTLKAFLPITTGSMKLTSVVPEKNSTHSKTSRLEWGYFEMVQFSFTFTYGYKGANTGSQIRSDSVDLAMRLGDI